MKEAPLAAAVSITEIVPFSREIDPLGMAEFVSHEAKVCLSTE